MRSFTRNVLLPLGLLLAGGVVHAVPALPEFTESDEYLGIHTGNTLFKVSSTTSVLGRINNSGNPAGAPGIAQPTASAQNLSNTETATFDGNIAITSSGGDAEYDFSTTNLYSLSDGGIECGSSAAGCKESVSNSKWFIPDGQNPDSTPPIGSDQGAIDGGNGVTGNVDFTDLNDEIDDFKDWIDDRISMADYTATIDLSSTSGALTGAPDYVLSDNVTINGGLNVIKIDTGGANDFSLNNTNFIVDGAEGSTFVFIIDQGNFLMSNVRILAGPDMDLNNIIFVVKRPMSNTDSHISFSNVEVNGAAFWDVSMSGNVTLSNVRGCGQWMGNQLKDWNDVSLARCAFAPAPIPLPAAAWFMLSALFGLGGAGWLRSRRSTAAS